MRKILFFFSIILLGLATSITAGNAGGINLEIPNEAPFPYSIDDNPIAGPYPGECPSMAQRWGNCRRVQKYAQNIGGVTMYLYQCEPFPDYSKTCNATQEGLRYY